MKDDGFLDIAFGDDIVWVARDASADGQLGWVPLSFLDL